MTTLLALLLAYAGLTALSLAMERHHRHVWHRAAKQRTLIALRTGGWLLIGLALFACVSAFAGSLGVVVWLGVLSTAAVPLVLILAYAPRAAAVTAACAPVAATVLASVAS